MKTVFAVLAAATILGVPAAHAQSLVATEVVANVPFDFHVGDTLFSAGKCRMSPASRPTFMVIRCAGDQMKVTPVFSSERGELGAPGVMRFARYGDQYYLTEVFAAGRILGSQVPLSKTAKEQLAGRTSTGLMEIAAR
jgi:hypothetical protein